MTNSILDSVKQVLGVEVDDTDFDLDIAMHINSVFATLHQLGAGPATGYAIENSEQEWTEFLGPSPKLNMVKSYVYIKVQMLFDPPSTSYALDAKKAMATEYESRIQMAAEPAALFTPPERVIFDE